MNSRDVERIIKQGEGLHIEFKQARTALPRDLFETVCAFLNRNGGHLVLGVQDNGTVVGVDPDKIESLKRDFTSRSNNPTTLNPPFLLEFKEVDLSGHTLLYVYIPESSQAHQCNNIVYDRRHEGDFRVIDSASISRIYSRKSSFYSESRIFPYLSFSDFKPGIMDKVRQLIRSRSASHPWLTLPDADLLRSAGLYRKDYQTGEEGYTLAAALLLGSDDVILSILPHYRVDAILRRENTDRYDDRVDIRTNLIEAYEMLMAFVAKHLPDRFYLQAGVRIDLRDPIFREIVANVLVHREYSNATPARFIIYTDRVETENANKPSGFGLIDPERFSPFPKNPTIAKFFVQLGRVEELGSGIRNVTKLVPYYTPDESAQFIEEDVFRAIVPVHSNSKGKIKPEKSALLIKELEKEIDKLPVLELIQKRLRHEIALFANGHVHSTTELSVLFGVSSRTIYRDFHLLLDADILQPADSFGFYELAEKWRTL